MRDLHSNIDTPVLSLAIQARTASANGTGVDLTGFEGAELFVEAGTKTDGTHTPTLEESDDNSTYSAVASGDMIGTFAALATNVRQRVGYIGAKRYVRGVATVSGATTGMIYGMAVMRGVGRHNPIA